MSTVIVATYTCDLCQSVTKEVAVLGQQLMKPPLTMIGAFEVCASCANRAVVKRTRRGSVTLEMKPRDSKPERTGAVRPRLDGVNQNP